MTGSLLAIVLIPIVTAVVLVIWLTTVFHADSHPSTNTGDTADMPNRLAIVAVLHDGRTSDGLTVEPAP